eukprot:TRINITY_DN306_c0_g1_i2.p1 TRINITY_DN306_c0_g1~~TRINITY_DN306_c0_g1_i2.p1  ORF type:complete len:158 (-),score=41.55 TRINITY_DN306_c0_g1_i2:46-519(-)
MSTLFVQIGRVIFINYGPYTGKTAVVLDIVDQARVFVEGPTTGVPRQALPLKWLTVTDIKLEIPRVARRKTLLAAITKGDLENKWKKNPIAKSLAHKETVANQTDFDRFKIVKARKQLSTRTRQELKTVRTATHKARDARVAKAKAAGKQRRTRKLF